MSVFYKKTHIHLMSHTHLDDITEGILRGVFQNFNPLCGRNPIETDLD